MKELLAALMVGGLCAAGGAAQLWARRLRRRRPVRGILLTIWPPAGGPPIVSATSHELYLMAVYGGHHGDPVNLLGPGPAGGPLPPAWWPVVEVEAVLLDPDRGWILPPPAARAPVQS